MVDFSSVSLRIMSPDGKAVLAELDNIDKRAQSTGKATREFGPNINKAALAGRELGFVMSGVRGGVDGAANAAGHLAEQIALASKSANVIKGALGVGLAVALGVQLFGIWKDATGAMSEFNAELNKIGNATVIANLQGRGPRAELEAKREEIRASTRDELNGLEKRAKSLKLNAEEEQALRMAIIEREKAQLSAIDRTSAYNASREVTLASEAARDQYKLGALQRGIGTRTDRGAQKYLAEQTLLVQRDAALRELGRMAEDHNYTEEQFKQRKDEIEKAFVQQTKLLDIDFQKEAQKIGDNFTETLAGSIAEGIATAIQSGNIGAGFRALTGSILIGLGDMMQKIGTESLVAAKLMVSIVNALHAFAPEGAIGPALLLIAAGGVLKGLGASMGGRGPSGGGGYAGGYAGAPPIIYSLNPAAGPNTAGLTAGRTVNVNNPVFLSPSDPTLQRQIRETIRLAEARG